MQSHHRARSVALLLLAVLLSTAATYTLAEPAAVVIQISGKVEVQRAGKNAPAAVGASLEAGDRLVVPTGGKAVVMYRTGKIETATATVTIEARQSEQVGGLYRQTVQTLVQVATTDAAKQPNRQGMIRPVDGMPTAAAPRNNIVLLDVRPRFSWLPLAGITAYTLQLRRTDVAGARPVRFQVTGHEWIYPATEPPLVPGATYEWTLAAGTNGRPAEVRSFRIIGTGEFAALSRVLNELTAAGVDPAADGLFVAALWYRDAGLYYEAERALARLAENGSALGRTFHLLRGDVFDRIGNEEERARAFQAADREPAS